MENNDLKIMLKCFKEEQDVNELVTLFMSKNLGDIRSLVTGLSIRGLSDSEKKELTSIYINYKRDNGITNVKLRGLICNKSLYENLGYHNFKKAICYYLYDNRLYSIIENGINGQIDGKEIIHQMEEYVIADIEQDESLSGNPIVCDNYVPISDLLYILTENPNTMSYKGRQGTRELIHFARKDKSDLLHNIIIDENLLQYTSYEKQAALMEAYMEHPSKEIKDLITDIEALQTLDIKQHLAIVRTYGKFGTEEKYNEMKRLIHDMYELKNREESLEEEKEFSSEDEVKE